MRKELLREQTRIECVYSHLIILHTITKKTQLFVSESVFCFNRLNGFHGQMRKSQCYCGSWSIENGFCWKMRSRSNYLWIWKSKVNGKGELENVIGLQVCKWCNIWRIRLYILQKIGRYTLLVWNKSVSC